MTSGQKVRVKELLSQIKLDHPSAILEFHFGLCIGADEQAAKIAKGLGFYIIAHPGYSPRNREGRMFRSEFDGNDEVREEKPFLKRDEDIVNEVDEMIATPVSKEEEIRSGTWTTIRFARRRNRPIEIVYP